MISAQKVNPAVRGIRAPTSLQSLSARITEEITQGVKKPFNTVIDVSSGDPHRAGMAPISFVRQVLAACVYPEILKEKSLPLDVRHKAEKLLGACGGGSVAGFTPDGQWRWGGDTGVLTPTPCPYTLPMLLDERGVTMVPYQLMEDRGWALDLDELRQALTAARGCCEPRAIYISNPGNPTGHVQDRKTIEEVIRFAATEGLVLLAEEVYQDSVYGQDKEFISYKKVLFEMGKKYSETVELISFNSISSACMGECGLRGGYMEVVNMDPAVFMFLRNMQNQSSPPVLPQLALEVMVSPPSPGDPSYETYTREILHNRTTLSQNAQRACDFLNLLPGMKCQPAMAGGFLYPFVHLPPQMIEEAKMLGVEADVLYCQRLLEEEGVCLGAGCENGQEDQNYHIRLCVMAPPVAMEEVLARLRSFHLRLLDRFP